MSQLLTQTETGDKTLLTYSALNTFRNCPRRYKNRYLDNLRPRERAEALSFGGVVHSAIELWYRSQGGGASWESRWPEVYAFIDKAFKDRANDPQQLAAWHLATAMMLGYARRYTNEDFEIVEVEKEFIGEIRNPETGRLSQTFRMAGKVDAIVRCHDGLYLLEHKTASTVDANYLDKLWTDTQIALYCYYLRDLGYPIVGVIYNVLLKSRLKQGKGETQAEYESRKAELAAKNKSGKSTAKRQLPETDEEFQWRLADWYSRPEAFHREYIYLSEDRLAMLQDEVWEITQQYLDARRRGKWLLNTSNCFSYQRPCEYLPYCQSGFTVLLRIPILIGFPVSMTLPQPLQSAEDEALTLEIDGQEGMGSTAVFVNAQGYSAFTLRELSDMADAAISERWNHTAALMAMLANVHRDAKKHKAFRPADFHPMARKSDGKIENVGVDVLKMLVKE